MKINFIGKEDESYARMCLIERIVAINTAILCNEDIDRIIDEYIQARTEVKRVKPEINTEPYDASARNLIYSNKLEELHKK